jgi:hypothetical protein
MGKGGKGGKKVTDRRRFEAIQRGSPVGGTTDAPSNPFGTSTTGYYIRPKDNEVTPPEGAPPRTRPPLPSDKKGGDGWHPTNFQILIMVVLAAVAAAIYVARIDGKVDLVKQSVDSLTKEVDRNYNLLKEVVGDRAGGSGRRK